MSYLLISFQAYLNRLIMQDTETQIQKVKDNSDGLNEDDMQDKIMDLERQCDNNTSELNSLFAKVDDRRRVCNCLIIQR